jgi:hypothetical protein
LRQQNNKTKKFLSIFSKYIKNNNKIIPLKVKTSDVGNTRYFPPVSKEWKNSIYVFNQNNLKNFPIYDLNINYLIKNFFNLQFNSKFLLKKYRSYRLRSYSLNKIYASKAEIKHTNNKAILTVYVYNREKISLLKKIKILKKSFYKKVKLLILKNKKIFGFYNPEDYNLIYNKSIKALLYKNLILLRKYKLRLSLNKYKFEEKLLYKLKNFIVKFYNKKVEFNIVNIRSVVFHSDFFTKILTSKILNRKANILSRMDSILNKVVLPKVNTIVEKNYKKKKDLNLFENKYKYLNISFILKNNNLSELLNKLYYNIVIDYYNNNLNKDYFRIYEIIFNSINYKNMGGVRLEAKGRLTKRYRADRALFKVRWKGGLKNIDSSYKGLSSVNMRGYVKPNLDYSIFTSKRRIGAFAVKGWVSGRL